MDALTTDNTTKVVTTGVSLAGDTNAHMATTAPTDTHEQTQIQTKQTPHTTDHHPCPTTLASTAEKYQTQIHDAQNANETKKKNHPPIACYTHPPTTASPNTYDKHQHIAKYADYQPHPPTPYRQTTSTQEIQCHHYGLRTAPATSNENDQKHDAPHQPTPERFFLDTRPRQNPPIPVCVRPQNLCIPNTLGFVMGRPTKPIEQQRRNGNPSKRKLPAPNLVVAQALNVPEPLRALGVSGNAFWNRVWAHGKSWISPTTDMDIVQLIAEQMDERALLYQHILRQHQQGIVDWQVRSQLRKLDSEIHRGLSSIGFTPEMRTRLGLAEVRAQHAIESLIQRRKSHGSAS